MAFTIYNWFDPGAPVLNGATGSLLSLLDAVLVTGYGTKPGAGWTKPFGNTSSYGTYKLGNGSTSSLFVYDAGSGSAGGTEALMTGWDSITNITNGFVTGSNPFPTFTQVAVGSGAGGSAGAIVVRKSNTTNSLNNNRNWIAFADSASFYLFTRTLDATFAARYSGFFFGDFYSIRSGSVDSSRCMIVGRNVVSSSAVANDYLEQLLTAGNALTVTLPGHYAAHGFSGSGASMAMSKHGNAFLSNNNLVMAGSLPFPNGPDNAIYVSPLWVVETPTGTIRGRMRGLWHLLHASQSIQDYFTFSGSGENYGRTFQVVATSLGAGGAVGYYTLETSNTLETNVP